MKRFLIILVLAIVLLMNYVSNISHFSFSDYFDGGTLCSYTYTEIDKNSISLGNMYLNVQPKINKKAIAGESIFFKNLEVGDALSKLKAKVISVSYIEKDDITTIYAYTNLIKRSVKVDGKKVNLEIAITQDGTTLGWPVILGSY